MSRVSPPMTTRLRTLGPRRAGRVTLWVMALVLATLLPPLSLLMAVLLPG